MSTAKNRKPAKTKTIAAGRGLELPVIDHPEQATRFEKLVILAALYTQVPSVNCKGLCWGECHTIGVEPIEAERIRKKSGLDVGVKGRCPALTEHNQCSIYRARPIICRLWGTYPTTACPHGCQPTDGIYFTDSEAFMLLYAVRALSAPRTLPGVDVNLKSRTTLEKEKAAWLSDARVSDSTRAVRASTMAAAEETEKSA